MRKSKSKTGIADEDDSVTEVERDEEGDASSQEENGVADKAKTVDAEEDGESIKNDTPPPKDPPKKRESRAKKAAAEAEEEESDEEYEVEKILDSKKIKGKVHFLIRWKGYQSESDTWEPEDTVTCPELIEKFKLQSKQSNGKSAKKRKSDTKAGSKKKSKSPKKSIKRKYKDDEDEDDDGDKEYEVEKIVEVHFKKNGKKEFLIHWKGWSSRSDTWEPEEHLSCPELIAKFMDKVKSKTSATQRDLRVDRKSTKRFTLTSKDTGRRLSKRKGNSQRVRYDDTE